MPEDTKKIPKPKPVYQAAPEGIPGNRQEFLRDNSNDEPKDRETAMRHAEWALKIMRAKNAVDQWSVPKGAWAEANVPGMRQLGNALRAPGEARAREIEQPPRDGGEIDEPQVRQPIQMQREFSNDADKEAYLERIRQAQAKAAK